MKKSALLLTLLLTCFCHIIRAQEAKKFHTPEEFLKIMQDSKLSYALQALAKPITSNSYDKLTRNDVYRVKDDSGNYDLKNYLLDNATQAAFDAAEKAFAEQKFDEAKVYYEKALSLNPKFYLAKTYLAEIYHFKKDFATAEKLFREVIRDNYIDFQAHWYLADLLAEQKKYKDAVDEITVAKILNRNNPRINASFDAIYREAKLKKDDWTFIPQYKADYDGEKTIDVHFEDAWTMYAICKAVWRYEPGYAAKMGQSDPETTSYSQEKECAYNEAAVLANGKIKTKDKALLALKKCMKEGILDFYIVYEILLPQKPGMALNFSEETILGMRDYVKYMHGGMKMKMKK